MNSQKEIDYEAERELECLVQALEGVIDAKNDQKEAYNSYQGVSPGYHLATYNDRVSDAIATFGNYLGKVIDRRVKANIENLRVDQGNM